MGWLQRNSDTTEHGYIEERLSAYLDGELSPQERMVVDRHLAKCQDCRWNLKTLRQTVRWTRELPAVSVPHVFTLPVPAQTARAPRPRRTFVPLLQGATALVALLLVLVVAGDVMLTGSLGARAPRSAAPMAQPAAKIEATQVAEVTKEVELEATVVVKETVVVRMVEVEMTKVVEAPPPSAVEKAVEMPAATALQPPATAVAAAMEQRVLSTATMESGGLGGRGVETQPAGAGVGLPGPEATETARISAPRVATTRAYITGAVEAMATLLPTLSPTGYLAIAVPITAVVEVTPAMLATATPAALPAATAESAPAMLPKAAPTALLPATTPTTVAEVQMRDQSFAAERGEETGGALQEPLVGWLHAAEIALGVAFILLAMATILVMIRRRRAG